MKLVSLHNDVKDKVVIVNREQVAFYEEVNETRVILHLVGGFQLPIRGTIMSVAAILES